MRRLQRYIGNKLLAPLLASLSVLVLLALLSQSLSRLDLIFEGRQGASVFLYIIILALPYLLALVLPLALFIAVLYTMRQLLLDNELTAAQTGGLTRWDMTSPALRLASFLLLINLGINLWVQPLSYREMRQTLQNIKTDAASTFLKPNTFTNPAAGLTLFIQAIEPGGLLRNILVYDARQSDQPITFTARSGRILENKGKPLLSMYDGDIQRLQEDGTLAFLKFDRYTFTLKETVKTSHASVYKTSDRYLHELLFPNPEDPWEVKNQNALKAEGHYRLSSPLYNITLTLIALSVLLSGGLQRTGYGRRLVKASVLAVFIRLCGFASQSAAETLPWMNSIQYAIPLLAGLIASWRFYIFPLRRKGRSSSC